MKRANWFLAFALALVLFGLGSMYSFAPEAQAAPCINCEPGWGGDCFPSDIGAEECHTVYLLFWHYCYLVGENCGIPE